ncbi:RNA polymerase sigma factor [Phaeocystidibacter luteus]|uniref:RNA polymerase sigma factor n=1 Tax=Phaeocystidibacter luteus TaxID=911197 RepID=A0A6N6RDY0_9FLAO|nr:RNA polymerase sigma factor [Phaeocystidibacter luteus]KAB2807738.1 RNA polymerase sigma factor [Phaeocystidibacter luteus]
MSKDLKATIKKCRENNRRAQFDLYQHCFDRLMLICNRYKRNREDALALLNSGFLKILVNLDKYDDKQNFFPWASTIMVRTAIDEYRSNRTHNLEMIYSDSEGDLEGMSSDEHYVDAVSAMSADEIKKLIFNLPDNERLVFTLHEIEGYKHHEIALELGVTERSTKRYLKSAKDMLKEELGKQHQIQSSFS